MDRKIERPRWNGRRLVMIGLVLAVAAALLAAAANGLGGRRLRVAGDRLQIAEIAVGPFEEYLPLNSEVIPIRTVFLDAIEGGRVEEIFVREGAMVESGDPLLRLSNTNLLLDIMYREAELFQQSNNLRSSELALQQYRLEMKRQLLELDFEIRAKERAFRAQKELTGAGLSPSNVLEDARDELDHATQLRGLTGEAQEQESRYREQQVEQLQASLERIRANLDLAKSKLEGLVIRAPVTGHLTSLRAEVGESAERGQRLGQVDVLDGFKLRALVDQHYIARLDKGQRAGLEHGDTNYDLVVDRISPEVHEGRCEVELLFSGAGPTGIRRGQTLHAQLRFGDASEALLLPRGGYFQHTGGRWIFVVEDNGATAVRRQLKLGLSNPRFFQVVEGLAPGERVVISSYEGFDDIEQLVIQ